MFSASDGWYSHTLNNPPAGQDAVLVDNPSRLSAAVEAIRQTPAVGFDTEFVGEATYEPRLCLIQVATEESIFLIDPMSRIDLREFWLALTAPGREIVAFAARQELLFCLRYAERLPDTVFDPQIAAGLVGFGYPLSHSNFVRQVHGIRLAGSEAYTDWSRRPLTTQQLDYAADDVVHLLAGRRALLDRAESLGRTGWLRGEFEGLLERVRQDGQEDRWWKTPGASRMDGRVLALLRELWRWRDNRARIADLPPRRVLSDGLMLEIAKRGPRNVANLFALRGMERPALRKEGPEMVAAVLAGLDVPEGELPVLVSMVRHDDPPQVALLGQLLAILANSLATEHQVAGSMLATTAELQEFVRGRLGLSNREPSLMAGWRGEILGQALAELLEGKRFVHVVDANSPSPLRITRFEGE